MQNLKKKKGFTIIELVIVIAVIAILAAVLIPTFSNVISKANASAALQEANNAYKEALIDQKDAALENDKTFIYVTQSGKTYKFTLSSGTLAEDTTYSGTLPTASADDGTTATTTYIWTVTDNKVVVEIGEKDFGELDVANSDANATSKTVGSHEYKAKSTSTTGGGGGNN